MNSVSTSAPPSGTTTPTAPPPSETTPADPAAEASTSVPETPAADADTTAQGEPKPVSTKRKLRSTREDGSKRAKLSGAVAKDYSPPSTRLSDLGGVDVCIEKMLELVAMPLCHPEIYLHTGVQPPRGVLLHGPPGCGKTMLAHAIAGVRLDIRARLAHGLWNVVRMMDDGCRNSECRSSTYLRRPSCQACLASRRRRSGTRSRRQSGSLHVCSSSTRSTPSRRSGRVHSERWRGGSWRSS